jgi:hypothetical protein
METQQVPPKNADYLLTLMIIICNSILAIISSFMPDIWFATGLVIIVSSTTCYVLIAPRAPAFRPSLKRPIAAFVVGFLPFIVMMIFRLLIVKGYPSQLVSDFIIFIPIALLLGASGFFYYKSMAEKKYLNIGIGILCTLIATAYFFLTVVMGIF